jgi:hypothetical protein
MMADDGSISIDNCLVLPIKSPDEDELMKETHVAGSAPDVHLLVKLASAGEIADLPSSLTVSTEATDAPNQELWDPLGLWDPDATDAPNQVLWDPLGLWDPDATDAPNQVLWDPLGLWDSVESSFLLQFAAGAREKSKNGDLQEERGTCEAPNAPAERKTTKAERQRRKTANTTGTKGMLYTEGVYKRRFCAYYPGTDKCKRGSECAFAHSREEYRGSLLPVDEEHEGWHSDDFYMKDFKTLWCPLRIQHDWRKCVYAHNYLDIRRCPEIGYGPQACPDWDRNTHQTTYDGGCRKGVQCPYAHGAKEQLYHPAFFKTVLCWDNLSPEGCPRGSCCAFYHSKEECRVESTKAMIYDYAKPLDDEQVEKLQADFQCPRPSLSDIPERSKPTPAKPARKKGAAVAPAPKLSPAILQAPERPQVPCVVMLVPAPIPHVAMQYNNMMTVQSQMALQYQMLEMQGQLYSPYTDS